ncbi:hypothetical protein [Chroococcus sp. FPU101]|uniref:hypothetical protein n=1 Tax=Chroococcus sp. FPU101 TaxID=1974212 RepID=UPI001A8D5EEB|nr:hypothetical protein [Chroococcus sp. FPU101]GFE67688.1 hypothetical protein CFPU101_02980 [Chroococcus sp. FPU101]
MNNSENNSSMRYLLARLKPFGRLAFWGPLGLLSLGLIFYWQYQQHPEWLIQITDQPETLDSYFRSPSVPVAQPNVAQPDAQTPQTGTNNPNDGNWATEWKKGLTQEQVMPYSLNNSKNLNKINNPSQIQNNQSSSSLFRPLLPPVRSNNQPATSIRPYQVPTAPTASENYLKTAVDQIPRSNSSSYYNTNVAPVNSGQPPYNPYPSYSGVNQPVNPTVNGDQPPTGYAAPPTAAPSYQPPSYGSTYARPIPPQPYVPPTASQQPYNPSGVAIQRNITQNGYQVQPSISNSGRF